MTIKQILEDLEHSSHPVARALHAGHGYKVLVIGFKKGMILKEHTAKQTARITVIKGSVIYNEGGVSYELDTYDTQDIPVDIVHSVEAKQDSLCLLTQGQET
ncbi:MAG: hypothetical protein GY751_24435 [Bacteroidetes bacterium]|nr:hypothetical protein [Bacteroidota bacterium]